MKERSLHLFPLLLLLGSFICTTPLLYAQTQPEYAFVANYADGTLSVIDLAKNSVAATVQDVGTQLSSVVVAKDGKRVYVGGLALTVIDATNNTVLSKIPVTGGV